MSAYITQRVKAALAHMRQGRAADAEAILVLVLKSQPENPDALGMMAALCLQRGQTQAALAHAQRAVRSDPKNAAARQTLVGVLTAAGEREAALVQIATLYEQGAGTPELAVTHAGTLRDLLRYEEAARVYREALKKHPGHPALTTMLAFSLNYTPGVTPHEVFEAHAAFGAMMDAAHPPKTRRSANTPDPDRPLRVGFMSADLHTHSVAYFLEPILAHADPAKIRAYLYQTAAPLADATTARLRQRAVGFRSVVDMEPGRIAETIVGDGIDVLLELNGLTSTTRALSVMNHAPAPITGTYIGYPHSTGLRSMNLRLVDSITDPPGTGARATEELVRLDPCFLCYEPVREAPDVNPEPPCVQNGRVTFGSFNNAQKLNGGVIDAWGKILQGVPGSRLVLKHFRLREPSLRKEILERFGRAGVASSRIELLPKEESLGGHLRLYERIDVALDPFPYNGTTTTCEAAYQGVPTVTVCGDRHAARVGTSLLSAIGVPELVADGIESYIAAAVGLANDRARLAGYRSTMRQKMLSSPLCDGPAFAGRFEGDVRERWRRWCLARTA